MARGTNPFRLRRPEDRTPIDPEELFQSLPQRVVESLWAHQADTLRAYNKVSTRSDVALELPTGAGKTLVGLLIGEYRRRAHKDRVLYLCPTRQLANQVGHLASDYGVGARVLVGPGKDYAPADIATYQMGHAIAITTYNGLFNANPRLSDGNTLIFDDAHAAAGPIADFWTVRVPREDQLYHELIEVLRAPSHVRAHTRATARDYKWVEVLPPPTADLQPQVEALLDESPSDGVRWPWINVRGHLGACQVYVSWLALEFRPIIPPTRSFAPFAHARHRVYMSATLGHGGEIERVFGVAPIERVPSGHAMEGSGRRLFLFPDYALDRDQAEQATVATLVAQPRSLVLCPDEQTATSVIARLKERAPTRTVLRAHDVEITLDAFTGSEGATLVLAGRYDGLDLPGEACRVLAVVGLPAATDLQERFLWSRLGGQAVLRDRVLTRLSQASGRCTRSPKDFAVVIPLGQELLGFCARRENQDCLNQDLHAEIDLGMGNSDFGSPDRLAELASTFLEDSSIRADIDADIASRRRVLQRSVDPTAAILTKQVHQELRYVYALWEHDEDEALEKARSVSDSLSGDDLRTYRSWWRYLAACAALMGGHEDVARGEVKEASRIAPALTWLTGILGSAETPDRPGALALATAAEGVTQLLIGLGHHGPRFERAREDLRSRLSTTEPRPLELAVTEVGRWLGFHVHHPGVEGAPDAVWHIPGFAHVAFEVKSDGRLDGAVSIADARQAAGHLEWLTDHMEDARDEVERVTVLISPRRTIHPGARAHARDCFYVSLGDLQEWVGRILSLISSIRSQSAGDFGRDCSATARRLVMAQLDPEHVMAHLKSRSLRDLP